MEVTVLVHQEQLAPGDRGGLHHVLFDSVELVLHQRIINGLIH